MKRNIKKFEVGAVFDHESTSSNSKLLFEKTSEIVEAETNNEALKIYLENKPKNFANRYNFSVNDYSQNIKFFDGEEHVFYNSLFDYVSSADISHYKWPIVNIPPGKTTAVYEIDVLKDSDLILWPDNTVDINDVTYIPINWGEDELSFIPYKDVSQYTGRFWTVGCIVPESLDGRNGNIYSYGNIYRSPEEAVLDAFKKYDISKENVLVNYIDTKDFVALEESNLFLEGVNNLNIRNNIYSGNDILAELQNKSETSKSFRRGNNIIKVWWVNDKVNLSVLDNSGDEIKYLGCVADNTGPIFPESEVEKALSFHGYGNEILEGDSTGKHVVDYRITFHDDRFDTSGQLDCIMLKRGFLVANDGAQIDIASNSMKIKSFLKKRVDKVFTEHPELFAHSCFDVYIEFDGDKHKLSSKGDYSKIYNNLLKKGIRSKEASHALNR